MKQLTGASLVVGLVVGLGVGFLLWGQAEPQAPSQWTPAATDAAPRNAPAPATLQTREQNAPPAPPTQAPLAAKRPAEAPPPIARSDDVERRVQDLADAIRSRALAQADGAEVAARAQVERQIAKERARLADLERGGTMKMLEGLTRDWVAPMGLVGDAERFAQLFERKTRGSRVDGRAVRGGGGVADGDAILLPKGRTDFSCDEAWGRDAFPKDVLLEGHGMDETLLVWKDEPHPRTDVHSLTFRDLTLHLDNNALLDMRGHGFSVRFESCRVTGWDCGAGGSCMVYGDGGAFYATDSRFEAGYGRSPDGGNLFRVQALLARLERCTFDGPFRSLANTSRNAAIVFDRCRILDMDERAIEGLRQKQPEVRLVECTFGLTEAGARPPDKPLPLGAINPAWGPTPR
jgi:hypothetical protein